MTIRTDEIESPPLTTPALFRALPLAIVLALLVIGLGLTGWLETGGELEPVAVILLVGLTIAAIPIFRRAARNDPDGPFLFQVLFAAWLAKLAAMSVKLYLLNSVFGGAADAVQYDAAGRAIAADLASGVLPQIQNIWGTDFVELLTGLFFFVTGPSFVGAWIVWSFLGTMGMLLQYKAFVTAFPAGNRRLYMALVFFAPSILMWTNALGKDALMAFTLGITAYGAARASRSSLSVRNLLIIGLGLGGALLVRPHVAAILMAGLVAVVLLRPIRAGMLTPVIRVATLLGFAVLAVFVVRTAATFINVDDLSVEGVTEFMETEQAQTEQGGSSFTGAFPTTPQGLGLAIVTVLFRPFPWEAPGLLGLAASAESMVILGLLLWRLGNVLRAWIYAFRDGYLAFQVVYVTLFVFFFSTIANFGILVRQRVQLLPFLFVLLAYQLVRQESTEAQLEHDRSVDRSWRRAVERVRG
jgi:hypothetical protein